MMLSKIVIIQYCHIIIFIFAQGSIAKFLINSWNGSLKRAILRYVRKFCQIDKKLLETMCFCSVWQKSMGFCAYKYCL